MQTLVALLVAAAAACAIARPPGPTAAPVLPLQAQLGPLRAPAPLPNLRDYLGLGYGDLILTKLLQANFPSYEDEPRVSPPLPENYWLNKEIYRINQMDDEDDLMNPYEGRWIDVQRVYEVPIFMESIDYPSESTKELDESKPLTLMEPEPNLSEPPMIQMAMKRGPFESNNEPNNEQRKMFALTPLDKDFYEHDETSKNYSKLPPQSNIVQEGEPVPAMLLEPPRQTRQNPNLSKQKNLLGPELGKLKSGLANKDYRLPVSLLPTNLRWLKVNQPVDDTESSHDGDSENEVMDHTHHIHLMESVTTDPADSIYGVALVAAVGAALTMAIFGFAFGWYILSKKAKAAADVDYPAYGVTGPTIDTSGDRKLAHSAHMYHYQHQKQQIIAMERNGLEQRTGSVSDPESEEENEEGDYTVYECPGFATTGDMEVKNPLFSEDPTPATPGKCEVVKQQPKD